MTPYHIGYVALRALTSQWVGQHVIREVECFIVYKLGIRFPRLLSSSCFPEGTWWLSPSSPFPICLFLSLASRAPRCDECGYLGLPTPTHAALGTRACCVRRSGCEQGGLRVVLAAVSAYKHREKCCPDCAGRCAREAKQPALLLMYTVSHASPSHRRHTCLTPTRLLHHLCMVTPVVSGTKNASSCTSCTHIANACGCTSPPP